MSLPILKRNNNSKSKNIEKIIFQPQPGPHSVPSIYPNELEKKYHWQNLRHLFHNI